MTVVAVFEDLQVAVSDVLLTTDRPGGHIVTPTTGNTGNLGYPFKLSPTRLVRKYVEFTSQCGNGMLLAAGDVPHIEKFAENVRDIAKGKCSLPAHIEQLLQKGTPDAIADAAVKFTEFQGYPNFEVIGSAGNQQYSRTFDATEIKILLPYFGVLRAIGSGARDVVNWLEARATHYVESGLDGESLKLKMIRAMHTLPAILLEEDTRTTLHTISKGVGGYYESYLMDKGELRPVDSVLTIFARVVGKPRDYSVEVRRLFFHLYINDCLMVVSLFNLPKSVTLKAPLKCPLSDFERFPIQPLFGEKRKPSWTVDLLAMQAATAKHTRLTLSRESRGGYPLVKRFFEGHQAANRLIDLKVSNGDLVITLNKEGFDHFVSRFPGDHEDPSVLRVI